MPGRPKKEQKTLPVRVPLATLKRVKRLAAHLDIDPGDYIAERLAPLLDRDEAKMLSDMAKERPQHG